MCTKRYTGVASVQQWVGHQQRCNQIVEAHETSPDESIPAQQACCTNKTAAKDARPRGPIAKRRESQMPGLQELSSTGLSSRRQWDLIRRSVCCRRQRSPLGACSQIIAAPSWMILCGHQVVGAHASELSRGCAHVHPFFGLDNAPNFSSFMTASFPQHCAGSDCNGLHGPCH